MIAPITLLAKSVRPDKDPVTLAEHLRDTDRAAEALFRADRRWGRSFCRFFSIEEHREKFLLCLRVACLFHDIGKANEHFLRAMLESGRFEQALRHEHISALILQDLKTREWLFQNPLLDVDVITAAVLSHHLKASLPNGPAPWGCRRNDAPRIRLHLDHPDVQATLERVRALVGLSNPIPLNGSDLVFDERGQMRAPWGDVLARAMSTAVAFARQIRKDSSRRMLLAAVKAGLIVADSVASAMVREGEDIVEWIDHVAHRDPLSGADVREAIIQPRLQSVLVDGKPAVLRSFQRKLADQPNRCLLLAGCGAGKTLAAWAWAAAQADKRQIGRVVFLYPTRGTATEGFRDYVGWAPEGEAALVHGTSRFELDGMRENPPDSLRGKDLQDEAAARLFALGLWSKKYFSATVDQFLAFLEHRYESLCLTPVMADAAIIIDEVHSFDRSMFENLITFLRVFRGPVLCMTATLPSGRREQLIDAGLSVFPNENERAELEDLQRSEASPRYRLKRVTDEAAARAEAAKAFAANKRVLWVVNTVARCQRIVRELDRMLGRPVALAYHSRYKLVHRKGRHENVVRAFRPDAPRPVIAVTTQVCEMSLDLDADVLITEHAPITSLVQRFGRANRFLRNENLGELITYPPEAINPYEKKEIVQAAEFLEELTASQQPLSQSVLAEALERRMNDEPLAEEAARLLSQGYFATPGSFRDEDDFSAQAVLSTDVGEVAGLMRLHKPNDGFVLPVPKKTLLEWDDLPPKWPKYLGVVDGARYDERLGYLMEES